MIETRIQIIRIMSVVVLTIAVFMIGWYAYGRFSQLTQPSGQLVEESDVNNPRLNRSTLESLTEEIKSRQEYGSGKSINFSVPEKDPFYN
jgi:hypothetical protein